MEIIKTLKGIFKVGRKSTKVTKRIVYDVRKSPKNRISAILIDDDDTIKRKTFIESTDGSYVYDPDEVNNTYEKTKIYKELGKGGKVLSNVIVINKKYPKTINFSDLRSDLGQLAVNTVSKVLYNTIIADALGKPSDKEKKYYFAIGAVLGMFVGFGVLYLMIRVMTG